MSIVVGLKYKDGVLLGSDNQITCGNIKIDNCKKIYKSMYSNTAYGVVGSYRCLNLLNAYIDDLMDYKDILDNVKIDIKYATRVIAEKILKLFYEHRNLLIDNNTAEFDGNIMIVSEDKIFRMSDDGAIVEYENYCSIGCGKDMVKGYFDTLNINTTKLEKSEAEEIIGNAIKKACSDDVFISDKIDIINLEKRG